MSQQQHSKDVVWTVRDMVVWQGQGMTCHPSTLISACAIWNVERWTLKSVPRANISNLYDNQLINPGLQSQNIRSFLTQVMCYKTYISLLTSVGCFFFTSPHITLPEGTLQCNVYTPLVLLFWNRVINSHRMSLMLQM